MQTQANSRLAGVKALRNIFLLELLQHYPTETQIWGAAAQVFKASLSSAVNVEFRAPGWTEEIFFKPDL